MGRLYFNQPARIPTQAESQRRAAELAAACGVRPRRDPRRSPSSMTTCSAWVMGLMDVLSTWRWRISTYVGKFLPSSANGPSFVGWICPSTI